MKRYIDWARVIHRNWFVVAACGGNQHSRATSGSANYNVRVNILDYVSSINVIFFNFLPLFITQGPTYWLAGWQARPQIHPKSIVPFTHKYIALKSLINAKCCWQPRPSQLHYILLVCFLFIFLFLCWLCSVPTISWIVGMSCFIRPKLPLPLHCRVLLLRIPPAYARGVTHINVIWLSPC